MDRKDDMNTGDPSYEEFTFPEAEPGADLSPEEGGTPDPYESNPLDRPPGETPSDGLGSHVGLEGTEEYQARWQDEEWLISKAKSIYTTSTDYLDANITNVWEKNLSHFLGQHAPGSAYGHKNYKRSRLFRPKTRAFVKQQEAAMAVAAFATRQFMDVEPEDIRSDAQRVSAQINKNALQYRLDRRMPWFLTVMGGWQDTKNYGVCISHQYWQYDEDEVLEMLDENGTMVFDEGGQPLGNPRTVVRADELACDLIAPENFRFDPSCDWRNPVKSSPYLVYMMPLYAGEALERMERIDTKTGHPQWKEYSLAEILATRRGNSFDQTRQAREGQERIDPTDNRSAEGEDTLVWAHMNVCKVDGEDIVFWTMGTDLLLTDPVPVTEAYPHLRPGERPFVVGYSSVEAHRNYPSSDVEQASGLQEEINLLTNNRIDNVRLVLNKRYFVRRGSQVDLEALMRNVSGGGVMMNDPEKDVVTVNTPDVTSSAYEEHNRLAVEMDELVGNFSQGSVQGNRNLNETVGGMDQISASASAVQDYSIRIFMETWMEPTLRQLLRLIQFYETDEVILTTAAVGSDLWQKAGQDKVTDDILRQDLTLRVNLGMGNTDPVRRVERLVYAIGQASRLPGMPERMKSARISDEIFGTLGYRDSSGFFMTDEEFQEMQSQAGDEPPPPEVQMKQMELDIRRADNEARNEREKMKLALTRELGYADLALKRELTLGQMFAKLGIDEMKVTAQRDQAALNAQTKSAEMNLKRATGEGI